MRTLLLAIFSLLALLPSLGASISDARSFYFLNRENGLPGETATKIITDHLGHTWVATSNGVGLYNGHSTISFEVPRRGSQSNFTHDICESQEHEIFIATREGVFCLGDGQSVFKRIMPEVEIAEAICHADKRLYVANRDGLHVWDGRNTKTVKVGDSPTGIDNSVRDIEVDQKGTVWFVSRYALNAYNPQTGKVKTIKLDAKLPPRSAFSHLALIGDRVILGTKNNGLYVYHRSSGAISPVEGVGSIVNHIEVTLQGDICVATAGSGAYLLNGKTLEVKTHFSTSADSPLRLPSDDVYCYRRDAGGVDWFGVFRFGLAHTYYQNHLFAPYRMGTFSSEGLEVRSFCKNGHEVMLGTNRGLFLIDESTQQVRSLPTERLDGMKILTAIVHHRGRYYVGSYDGGLAVVDPQTMTLSRLSEPLLSRVTVPVIEESPQGELWIGTSEGLFILHNDGKIDRYTENNSKIAGGTISGITFDQNKNAWVTGSAGLSIYVPSTKVFDNDHFPEGFFHGEGKLSSTIGNGGKLFFYSTSGIYHTDPRMQQYGKLNLPDGLLRESCLAFLDDQQGYYWLATEAGLFRFSYDMQRMQRFGYGDGLSSGMISSRALRREGSEVWVGTARGLMRTSLKSLELWKDNKRYQVQLYDVHKNGTALTFADERAVNDELQIRLPWNIVSATLSARLILPDYARPEGRLFQYRVDEGEWKPASDGEDIIVGGLWPGLHTLDVRLAGADGTMRSYDLTVYPSSMAFAELLLLVIAVGLWIYWRRFKRRTSVLLAEREEIENALVEMEQQQNETLVEMEQKLVAARERADQAERLAEKMQAGAAELAVKVKTEPKYEHVRIDEEEFRAIADRLRTYIEKDRVFTNADLKMRDVAKQLHLSASKLSQVFSLYLKQNYYDFINDYRLAEFKRLIAEGKHKQFTLSALSEQCGFRKSSFFSTFRRVEGMTPTEWVQKNA